MELLVVIFAVIAIIAVMWAIKANSDGERTPDEPVVPPAWPKPEVKIDYRDRPVEKIVEVERIVHVEAPTERYDGPPQWQFNEGIWLSARGFRSQRSTTLPPAVTRSCKPCGKSVRQGGCGCRRCWKRSNRQWPLVGSSPPSEANVGRPCSSSGVTPWMGDESQPPQSGRRCRASTRLLTPRAMPSCAAAGGLELRIPRRAAARPTSGESRTAGRANRPSPPAS